MRGSFVVADCVVAGGNFVLNLVVKNFLLSFQLLVDEEEEFLEEDEDISKSESLNDTQNTFSQESHVSQTSLGATSDLPGGLSRSLKKSTAFHDRTSLEQQVTVISHVCGIASATAQFSRRHKVRYANIHEIYSSHTALV